MTNSPAGPEMPLAAPPCVSSAARKGLGGLDPTRTTGRMDVQARSHAQSQICGTRRPARRPLRHRDSTAGRQYVGQGPFPEKSGEQLGGESLVTVELFDRGASTEMIFTHTDFESAEIREGTRTGWLGCFEVLARLLEGSPA